MSHRRRSETKHNHHRLNGLDIFKAFALIIICSFLASCGGGGGGENGSSTITIPPNPPEPAIGTNTYPGISWEVRDPQDAGVSVTGINEALDYAFRTNKNTQGVVIIRHGVIIGERYADDKSDSSLATSWSTGKSFASALIGIALDKGYIASIDESADTYLPEWVGTGKSEVTIRSILEMRSGLGVGSGGDANIYSGGGINGDQLAFALNRNLQSTPRTQNWSYSNADSMLMAGIIEESTGQSVLDFADRELFSKIDMQADWWTDELGHAMTYCCIDTTTRDFARFGLLFARKGKWRDEQLISESWVAESTQVPNGTNNQAYALQWWVNQNDGYFYAAGLHTNNIYVFPQLDLVVVRNSDYAKIGSSSIRTGNNYHSTTPPLSWSNSSFLQPIVNAIEN